MLNKDPNKRPNINGILRFPVIQERVRMLLNEDDFKDEFSHTLLHGQNVFDEFRAKQAEAKAKAARDKAAAEEQKELQEKMMKLQISDTNYKPKTGQDPSQFNEMYLEYISRLSQDNQNTTIESNVVSERPYSQQSSAVSSTYEDRNDEAAASDSKTAEEKQLGQGQMNMINISACEFDEFQKYM